MKSDCYFDECKHCIWREHSDYLVCCLSNRLSLAWHRLFLEMPIINKLIEKHKFCHMFKKEYVMETDIICAKCNGRGYTHHFEKDRAWTEPCNMCDGIGKLGKINISEINADDIDDTITITKKEYEELLEYKHMYEDLCK